MVLSFLIWFSADRTWTAMVVVLVVDLTVWRVLLLWRG